MAERLFLLNGILCINAVFRVVYDLVKLRLQNEKEKRLALWLSLEKMDSSSWILFALMPLEKPWSHQFSHPAIGKQKNNQIVIRATYPGERKFWIKNKQVVESLKQHDLVFNLVLAIPISTFTPSCVVLCPSQGQRLCHGEAILIAWTTVNHT